MEELLMRAARQAMQGELSTPQEYTGKWTFIDMLKSVDCNDDDTVAWWARGGASRRLVSNGVVQCGVAALCW